jgi:hypothetical protein
MFIVTEPDHKTAKLRRSGMALHLEILREA